MALTKCKECGKEVSKKAEACPHCGARLSAKQYGCGTLIVLGVLVLILIGIFSPDTTPPTPSKNESSTTTSSRSPRTESSSRANAPPLELLSFRCEKEYSYVFVSGEVKNVSSQKLKNVMAVGEFRASDGSLVKSEDALIDYNPILPGQSSPFKAGGTDNPAIKSCNISFKYLLGGTIGYTSTKQNIKEAQELLSKLGYDPGGADGIMGPKTRAAIKAFQQKQGLPQTGAVDSELLQKLHGAK